MANTNTTLIYKLVRDIVVEASSRIHHQDVGIPKSEQIWGIRRTSSKRFSHSHFTIISLMSHGPAFFKSFPTRYSSVQDDKSMIWNRGFEMCVVRLLWIFLEFQIRNKHLCSPQFL